MVTLMIKKTKELDFIQIIELTACNTVSLKIGFDKIFIVTGEIFMIEWQHIYATCRLVRHLGP